MTALLVTTKSPKDCEDGWLTGYIITLSMFSVCVVASFLCYAICEGLKLKTEYYLNFFLFLTISNIVLIFFNLIGNAISGNDCGVYSVRGFAAGLISFCTFCAFLLSGLIAFMTEKY
jgi:energy-coupling factor transporter transmembrane protein EcfT